MILLRKDILEECARKHADVRDKLSALVEYVEQAEWQTSQDIRKLPGADWLGKNSRVVFNVKGNSYRVIAEVDFERHVVMIRFAGTHAEYDKIDAETV